jgi:hypothetical protein
MGQLEQAIGYAIKSQAERALVKTVCWGVATEVTETTCTVERDEAPTLHDVLLNAVDDDLESHVTVYPKAGSNVLVAIVENLKTEAAVVKCSEVEKVKIRIGEQTLTINREGFVFNDGKNGGLVKIGNMVDWMQKLHADLQTLKTLLLTHPVAGAGSPLGLIFEPLTPSPGAAMFENKDIKQ